MPIGENSRSSMEESLSKFFGSSQKVIIVEATNIEVR